MLKSIGKFFADILKQIIAKVITYAIIIFILLMALKYFLKIDLIKIFG